MIACCWVPSWLKLLLLLVLVRAHRDVVYYWCGLLLLLLLLLRLGPRGLLGGRLLGRIRNLRSLLGVWRRALRNCNNAHRSRFHCNEGTPLETTQLWLRNAQSQLLLRGHAARRAKPAM
jgi:hypothetical protein